MSDRVATARNQTVEQKIRDDPDLSEVRLIFKYFQLYFYSSHMVFYEYIIFVMFIQSWDLLRMYINSFVLAYFVVPRSRLGQVNGR